MEYGNKSPSIKNLYLLCQALDITADYILGGILYPQDEEQETAKVCEEIMGILKKCDSEQIKGFRDISIIYANSVAK